MIPTFQLGQLGRATRAAAGGDPTTDPNFADVQLLAHFDGADDGTVFTDHSSFGRTLAATTGSPVTKTGTKKFGTASLRLAGSQILGAGVASDWSWMHQVGAKWTWEGWCSFDSFAAERTLFSTSNGSTGDHGVYACVTTSRYLQIFIFRGVASTFVVNATFNGLAVQIPNDTNFHHVAIQWDQSLASGNLTAYINGVLAGTANKTADAPSASAATAALKLGGFATTGSYIGYMDDVRLTKDVIRYAAPFTPRTSAFPNSA